MAIDKDDFKINDSFWGEEDSKPTDNEDNEFRFEYDDIANDNQTDLSEENNEQQLIPVESISLSTVINVLISKGYLTHSELSEAESARWNLAESDGFKSETASQIENSEVQSHVLFSESFRDRKPVKYKFLRTILSKSRWGRKFGTRIFGWKWRRRTAEYGSSKMRQ